MNLTIKLIDWFSDVNRGGGEISKKKAKIQEILSLHPLVVLHPPQGCRIYASGLIILESTFSNQILRNYSLAPVDESKVHTHFTCIFLYINLSSQNNTKFAPKICSFRHLEDPAGVFPDLLAEFE